MSEPSDMPTDATATPVASAPSAGDPSTVAQPAVPSDAGAPGDSAPWSAPADHDSGPAAVVAERPEIAVGAAFAGGLVLALILKRLAR